MKGMLTIFKKELARFFGDKRMAFTAILLPGILIYILYSFMGSTMMDTFEADVTLTPTVAVTQVPASLKDGMEQFCTLLPVADAQEAQEQVASENANAALLFPADFDAQVSAYEPGQGQAPVVELYFNTSSADSQPAYNGLLAMLNTYESSLANKFDIAEIDAAPEEAEASQFFAMMLPMLLTMFLFSACMSVAPESIAGEKERGTIATLLITPISRSNIALGKIMALSLIALLSGASSTLGTILSMPKLIGTELGGDIYGVQEYLMLAAVIFSTVLLLITLISVISAFAKTVKEATTMVMPVMILVMFLGIMAMSGSLAAESSALFLI
ncbi:MAG: ABC transporter permease, partial [Oscillospiraceae bacterium]|nr:ABC transporter permease [Oscillospiraceae bacterium]